MEGLEVPGKQGGTMIRQVRGIDSALLVIVATVTTACQASNSSGSPPESSNSLPGASAAVMPSQTVESSATASDTTAASATPAISVTIKAIPDRRWGDPSFKTSAKASNGKPVTYAASGGCTVNAATGLVKIQSAGSC